MVLENNYLIQKFDPEVLREYDIRGVVNENINENTAYTIGRTFGFVWGRHHERSNDTEASGTLGSFAPSRGILSPSGSTWRH